MTYKWEKKNTTWVTNPRPEIYIHILTIDDAYVAEVFYVYGKSRNYWTFIYKTGRDVPGWTRSRKKFESVSEAKEYLEARYGLKKKDTGMHPFGL